MTGRSDACGVCVCVELQAFCIFGLNCLLAGRSDALRAMTFTGTYFCCVVRGKYRVCRAAFFVKLWMLGFGFDMSERMSEDMSESMSKDMSERMSEDMSERVSKDLSERMSKDMSERCQKECQKICQKNVRRYIRRFVRKNVKRYVRKNVRR